MHKLYEVDPDADTLLIIPHPSLPFAQWDHHPPSAPPSPTTTAEASSVYAGILRGTSRPPNIYATIASNPPAPPPPETRIKVSSKHLSLASKHFRTKFRHLTAADADDDDGRWHVTLSGYDPAAVAIVMDAVHGRGRKVPRAVGLETLARVAVVVDAFRCAEAVEAYADGWFSRLDGGDRGVLRGYGRDLMLWVYVCYVFRQGEAFRRATREVVLGSDGPVRTLGLHIRAGLIKEIDLQRQQAVRKALEIVHEAMDALQDEQAPCSLGCDTFILGALVKTLRRAKLVWPQPSKPFTGISFAQIVEAVKQAQAEVSQFIPGLSLSNLAITQQSRKRKSLNSTQPGQALTPESSPEARATLDVHRCAAQTGLVEALRELEAGVDGLELESKLGYYLY